MIRKSLVQIIATGKAIVVKPWGDGAVDDRGDFYHRTSYDFMQVIE